MLAVVKEKSEPGVAIKNVPRPRPARGEVLVKVRLASICGTDIGIYDWTPWAAGHIRPPVIIGHEVVGEVLAVNGQTELKQGDLISSETHIFCDRCYQCRVGNRHICENLELFGIGRPGGFAEYATIPIRTAWRNDPRLPLKWLSVQEPLGNAVHAVSQVNVAGKRVVIFGLGPTGLCAAAVAEAFGAGEIIGINPGAYRRKLGRAMGCSAAFAALPAALNSQADVVFEMAGCQQALEEALAALRPAGTIVFFGLPKKPLNIDIGRYFINKEIRAFSVFGRKIWATWYQTAALLKAGQIKLDRIITHAFKLKAFEKAMAVMKSGQCGKVILRP